MVRDGQSLREVAHHYHVGHSTSFGFWNGKDHKIGTV